MLSQAKVLCYLTHGFDEKISPTPTHNMSHKGPFFSILHWHRGEGDAHAFYKRWRGSYFRLIDSCITQLKAHGPSRTCNESEEEEEDGGESGQSGGQTCGHTWGGLMRSHGKQSHSAEQIPESACVGSS